MNQSLKIGFIGDSRYWYTQTGEALSHVSNELSMAIDAVWLPTTSLGKHDSNRMIKDFHGLLAGPGDYENPDGVVSAIRFCREQQWPFLGT